MLKRPELNIRATGSHAKRTDASGAVVVLDGREHEPDGGAAQSLRCRYRRACCGPKALPLGLRDREVAAPSLSYREPPSTRSVVVYIGGVATRSKKRAQASIEIAPGGDWHIVPLAGLCD